MPEYIIVGDGYAALFFAHQLIKHRRSFLLFSEGKKSASQVSAGIINPVVLKKFTTFWKAQEQINGLKKTLAEIEQYTGKNYWIEANIHRIFHDEKERELWLKKSQTEELTPFLAQRFETLSGVENPHQTGSVMQSARLNVADFFSDMMHYLEQKGHLVLEKFDYALLNPSEQKYGDIRYKHIVFAEGMGVKANPFFSEIPVNPNKGHHLKVKLSSPIDHSFTVKKKHFLFPMDANTYYYGGTYDREQYHNEVDESAKNQLLGGLSEIYKEAYEMEAVHFGFRPTVKDRRPLMGAHSEFDNLYVFNGLGARGVLNGSYFSEVLYQHISQGIALPHEVRWNRFS